MKIYISGKISGTNLTETRARFAAAADAMKSLGGYEPVNPLENGLTEHDTWEAHILKDIADLLQCKAIYMLQGWQDSKVARAIQKSTSAATHKRMRLRDNKFTDEDFQRIRDFYIEKLRNIENLE